MKKNKVYMLWPLFFCLSFSVGYTKVTGILKSTSGDLKDYSGFVIYIKEGADLPKIHKQKKNKVMGQVNKKFSPAVIGIHSGDYVDFKNFDDIYHNVFSLDPKNKFDLGVIKQNQSFTDDLKKSNKKSNTKVKFKKPGKTLVFCNIHEDMMGTIYSFDHGYFTMATKSGLFELPSPESGEYTIVVDGERMEEPLEQKIKFKKKMGKLKVFFKPINLKNTVEHKNKNGEKYKEKSWELGEDDFY